MGREISSINLTTHFQCVSRLEFIQVDLETLYCDISGFLKPHCGIGATVLVEQRGVFKALPCMFIAEAAGYMGNAASSSARLIKGSSRLQHNQVIPSGSYVFVVLFA